jgi:hypothetical protein
LKFGHYWYTCKDGNPDDKAALLDERYWIPYSSSMSTYIHILIIICCFCRGLLKRGRPKQLLKNQQRIVLYLLPQVLHRCIFLLKRGRPKQLLKNQQRIILYFLPQVLHPCIFLLGKFITTIIVLKYLTKHIRNLCKEEVNIFASDIYSQGCSSNLSSGKIVKLDKF